MKKQSSIIILSIIITMMMTACGPGELLGPTITPTPTNTSTSTSTPTSTLTPTPTYTPTVTPSFTPTLVVPVLLETPFPTTNTPITLSNVGQLKELAVWFSRSDDKVKDFAFSPSTSQLITLSEKGIQVREIGTGRIISNCPGITSSDNFAVFPDGKTALWEAITTDGHNSWLSQIDLQTCDEVTRYAKRYGASPEERSYIVLSPDGHYLAYSHHYSLPSVTRIWNSQGMLSATIPSDTMSFLSYCWSPDNRMFAIASYSYPASPHIEIRNEEGTEVLGTLYPPGYKMFPDEMHEHRFYPVYMEFSSDSQWLAASDPFVTFLFNIKTGEKRGPFHNNTGKFQNTFMVLSPDSSILALANIDMVTGDAATADNYITLIDPTNGQIRASYNTGIGIILSLKFSPDGKYLASINDYGTLVWWGIPAHK